MRVILYLFMRADWYVMLGRFLLVLVVWSDGFLFGMRSALCRWRDMRRA